MASQETDLPWGRGPRMRGALTAAALVTLWLGLLAPAASAQTADSRWAAWLGCWTKDLGSAAQVPDWTKGTHVCVIPGTTASAINIVTITDNTMTSREVVDADGSRHPLNDVSCTGWRQATWSADGLRVLQRGESVCGDAKNGTFTGISSVSATGEWLDVLGVTSDGDTGVRTVRYRPWVGVSPALPAEVVSLLQAGTPAIDKARAAAAAPASVADVIEVARENRCRRNTGVARDRRPAVQSERESPAGTGRRQGARLGHRRHRGADLSQDVFPTGLARGSTKRLVFGDIAPGWRGRERR